MSSNALTQLGQTPDVLSYTLFGAAVLHAVVFIGVSFSPVLDRMRTPPALEVILVQDRDSEAPDEAEYIAQSSQEGGGQTDDNSRPSSPFVGPSPTPTDGVAMAPVEASSPLKNDASDEEVLTAVFAEDDVKPDEEEEETRQEENRIDTVLIEENLDIAALSAEIERQQEKFAKRPKIKTINARTTESASAEYMYAWVEQVERVGNLNYPDEARRSKLTGALVLIVGIYKSGEIESVTVDESSGHKILDDAARRIVELSGPFAAMTGALADETDILYIVRTWEFQSGNSVVSY